MSKKLYILETIIKFCFIFSCSEKRATNITIYFPMLQGKFPPHRVVKFIIPDGVNGGGYFGAYDPALDTPYTSIAPNNIAYMLIANNVPSSNSKF